MVQVMFGYIIQILHKGADRPKTQNQFLKVGTEHHNSDIIKSEVGMNKNTAAVQDMKMENDGQSETVFGQSGGGMNIWKKCCKDNLRG